MTQLRIRSWFAGDTEQADNRLLLGHAARILTGLVLLTAAGLKAYQAIWLEPPPAGILTHGLVAFEIALGLWLISGLTRRLAHVAALFCFLIFITVNFSMGHMGYESCGCYGAIEIHPWVSALINLGIILALGLTLPKPSGRSGGGGWLSPMPRNGPTGLAAAITIVALPTLVLMAQDRREAFDPDRPDQARAYAEPEQWLGGQLPIFTAIDQGERLRHGQWEVIFYRHTCPACRRHVDEKLETSPPSRHTRRMLVEIPPYHPSTPRSAVRQAGWRYAQLTDSRSWFFSTPTTVHLEDGLVVQVNDEKWTPGTPAPATADADATVHDLATSMPGRHAPIDFDPPPPHDLGYVPTSGTREFAFAVHNPLDRYLTIRRVEVECICTNVLDEPEVIPAGQTIEIPIRFEALPDPQRYAKGIVLYTNEPGLPVIELTVQAEIGIPLAIAPAQADAAQLVEAGETTVTVHNRSDEPIRLLYSRADVRPGSVFAAVPREAIEPGGSVQVPVRPIGELGEGQEPRGYVRIHTNSREQSVLNVPLR